MPVFCLVEGQYGVAEAQEPVYHKIRSHMLSSILFPKLTNGVIRPKQHHVPVVTCNGL